MCAMYLDLYSKDGHRYIRISESVRVEKNGARVTRKKVALLFIRIIQNRLKSKGISMSAERICKALNKWQVEKLADEYYRFNGLQNKDVSDILNAFEIEIPKKLYRIGDLKHIKQTIKFSK